MFCIAWRYLALYNRTAWTWRTGVFVPTDRRTTMTDGHADYFTPCTCTWGNDNWTFDLNNVAACLSCALNWEHFFFFDSNTVYIKGGIQPTHSWLWKTISTCSTQTRTNLLPLKSSTLSSSPAFSFVLAMWHSGSSFTSKWTLPRSSNEGGTCRRQKGRPQQEKRETLMLLKPLLALPQGRLDLSHALLRRHQERWVCLRGCHL